VNCAVLQVTAILPGFEIFIKLQNYLSISVEIPIESKHNTYALRNYQNPGSVEPNWHLLPAFQKGERVGYCAFHIDGWSQTGNGCLKLTD